MRKNLLLIALFCFISYTSSAQKIVDAYIIDLQGDTLKGKIFIPQNQENYLRINFSPGYYFDNGKQYQPWEIIEYGYITDQVFTSVSLPQGQTIAGRAEVYMKVLVKRPNLLSLFAFRDQDDHATYFLRDKDERIIRLSEKDYKNELIEFSENCKRLSLQKHIDKLRYNTVDLANFVNFYNSCLDENYIVDDSYLSDGIKSLGLRLGTGVGFIVSNNNVLDSPDILATLSFEYSLSSLTSFIFEMGYSKRTLTNEYYQKGRVDTFFPSASLYGNIKTNTLLDLRMLRASLFLKKKFSNLYMIIGGGMGYKLKSSQNYYAAITDDQEFRQQFERSLYVKNEIRLIRILPSMNLALGKSFTFNSFDAHAELTLTYLHVIREYDKWNKQENGVSYHLVSRREDNSYTSYTVAKPMLPKLLIDISFRIPLVRL